MMATTRVETDAVQLALLKKASSVASTEPLISALRLSAGTVESRPQSKSATTLTSSTVMAATSFVS